VRTAELSPLASCCARQALRADRPARRPLLVACRLAEAAGGARAQVLKAWEALLAAAPGAAAARAALAAVVRRRVAGGAASARRGAEGKRVFDHGSGFVMMKARLPRVQPCTPPMLRARLTLTRADAPFCSQLELQSLLVSGPGCITLCTLVGRLGGLCLLS